MRRSRKATLIVALLVLGIYLGLGFYGSLYSPERSNTYLWGVYHVHSTLSDGVLSPEGIANQARAAGVSLVLLTDHGNPNVGSTTLRKVVDGVTVVGGSESNLPEGHLALFGARELPIFNLPAFPPAAVADAREWGAFTVLAYPEDSRESWTYWEPDFRPDGMEVGNLYTCLLQLSAAKRLWLLLQYPFSRYSFLKYIFFPATSMARWDEFLTRGKVWGLVGSDAHGGFNAGKYLAVPVPSYASAFSIAALGFDRRYSSTPEEAIRTGDFFICIRGAGEPQQFEFFASRESQHFPSGSSPPAPADLHVRVQTNKLAARLVLKKDGIVVTQSTSGMIDFPGAQPGVYRAEVYLNGHPLLSPDVPWILSNPIFVGGVPDAAPEPAATPVQGRALDLASFTVEKDPDSTAQFDVTSGSGQFTYHLENYAGGHPARSCAIARHEAIDLSQTRGFYIRAVSDSYLRYLVELRSGKRRYYATFKVYPGKEMTAQIPYGQFYRVDDGRESLPLASIDTVMVVMNEYNSRTGFTAALRIRELGFY